MAGPIRIAILANGAQARREMSQVASSADGLGSKMGKASRVLAGGAALGGAALAGLGVSAIRSASEAQQSLGATESVFKKYANTVIDRSNKAATSVGLSANEYRELSNVTGAMLKNSGKPLREVTDLTAKLTGRAADLAATYGGTTKEAIEAVNALLRGEADPIERYGVSIKQSDINARLAAKGLDKLEGSAKKQADAQARLSLLFGQTKDAAGQFRRENGTLAGQQQRLTAEFANTKSELGTALIPLATDFFKVLRSEGVPAVQKLAGWLSENSDEITDTGRALSNTLVPAAKTTVGVVGDLVGFVSKLPPGLLELAGSAGVAAYAFPKLNGVVQAAGVSYGNFTARSAAAHAQLDVGASRAQRLQASLSGLGGGLRNVAGIGGMVALQQGASTSNTALSTLANVGGGALMGFAAGPVGGAVGAVAGALLSLSQNADRAGASAADTEGKWRTYANTLDQVTGSTTRATGAMAFQELAENGVLTKLNALGISNRQAVNATLGRTAASSHVAAALGREQTSVDKLKTSLDEQKRAYIEGVNAGGTASPAKEQQLEQLAREIRSRQSVIDKVRNETGAVARSVRNKQEEIWATTNLGRALKGLPEYVKTDVRALNTRPTLANVQALARQYKLQPKEIRTLVKLTGSKQVAMDTKMVQRALEGASKTKADLGGFRRGVEQGVQGGKRSANRGASDIGRLLFQGTGKAKANTTPFQTSLRNGMTTARASASSGGSGIGNALSNGAAAGIRSRAGSVASEAASMVRGALAAARAEAQVRSPSRKTRKIGHQMGDGLAVGLKQRRAKAKREAEALVRAVTARLDAARTKYRDLFENRAQYASAIRETVRNTGTITELGKSEDGTVAISALLDQLKTKVNQAKRFSFLVQQLAKKGLSKANIDQLLNAGPEAATATAEAITVGGASAIKQLNSLTYQLDSTGTKLGNTMANSYYKNGVDAASGLVRGLESQLKKVEAAAKKLADAAKKGTKKRLKSNSPSKVFEQIGRDTVRGFTIGLDETTARRQATRMADGVVKGFGTPALDAYMSTVGQGSTAEPRYLHLTADEIDQLQRGRTLQADLDAWRLAGGRARS